MRRIRIIQENLTRSSGNLCLCVDVNKNVSDNVERRMACPSSGGLVEPGDHHRDLPLKERFIARSLRIPHIPLERRKAVLPIDSDQSHATCCPRDVSEFRVLAFTIDAPPESVPTLSSELDPLVTFVVSRAAPP